MSIMSKRSGRENDEMRPVSIETGMAEFAEGSALISFGKTRVWCTATVEERVPGWLEGKRRGWVTGEYAMLPRSTTTRISWDRSINSGRSQEIARLIGRSLRAGIDLKKLGERMITIDCVVLQADGGTRTAAITGGFVALSRACNRLVASKQIKSSPIISPVAAVSAGIVSGQVRLDLDYLEDSKASVDCNVVMNGRGELIEVQATGEERAYTREQLDAMIEVAGKGIRELLDQQGAAIGG